jgi:hypothetical protein
MGSPVECLLKNNPNLVRQLVVDEGVSPSHSNGVGQSAVFMLQHFMDMVRHRSLHSLCFSFGKGIRKMATNTHLIDKTVLHVTTLTISSHPSSLLQWNV